MNLTLDVLYKSNLLGVFKLFSATVAFFIFAFCSKRQFHIPAFKYLKLFALTMGLWDMLEGIFYLTPNTSHLPFIALLFYLVIPFTSLTFFYYCFTYVFPNKRKLLRKLYLLAILPCITVIMIVIPPLQRFFIIFPGDVILNPLRDTTRLYQPWFYVHTYYSYAIVIAGSMLLLYRIIRPGNTNPIQCLLINIASLTFIGANAYNVFFDTDKILFLFPFLTIFCINIYFWTLYFDETERTIYSSQGNFVDTLKFPIIVLNKKNYIIFMNPQAEEVTTLKLGDVISPTHYHDSFPDFIPHSFEGSHFENHDFFSTNLILIHKKTGYFYYLHDHPIYSPDNKKTEMGKMLILITISAFNAFFKELEQKAFIDTQSNCYNRRYLELKQNEFQAQEFLPFSLIICDLDNLKLVNDTFGHGEGDTYIDQCVQQIYSSVRKTDFVFRFGGDEFLIMLPNTPQEIAEKICENISSKAGNLKNNYPFHVGISVGSSTATTFPFNMETLIADADRSMYKNKKKRKSSQ